MKSKLEIFTSLLGAFENAIRNREFANALGNKKFIQEADLKFGSAFKDLEAWYHRNVPKTKSKSND